MTLSNEEYARYRRRLQSHMDSELQDDQVYMNHLARLYRNAMNDIQQEINSMLQRFANDNGLSMSEARKKISKTDVQAYKDKKDGVKQNVSQRGQDALNAFNVTTRINRLQLLNQRILLNTVALASEEEASLLGHLNREFTEEYKWQSGFMEMTVPSQKHLERLADASIRNSFHNAHFSDRIWTNQKELQNRLETVVQRSLIQGRNPREGARQLQDLVKKEFSNKKYAADRLAITETARVQAEASKQSMQDNGFSQYVFMAENDNRTCVECDALDGEVFNVRDAVVGENLQPIHPSCRCMVSPYMNREEWERSLEERGL